MMTHESASPRAPVQNKQTGLSRKARASHPVKVGGAGIVLRHRHRHVQVQHGVVPATRDEHRLARALRHAVGDGRGSGSTRRQSRDGRALLPGRMPPAPKVAPHAPLRTQRGGVLACAKQGLTWTRSMGRGPGHAGSCRARGYMRLNQLTASRSSPGSRGSTNCTQRSARQASNNRQSGAA